MKNISTLHSFRHESRIKTNAKINPTSGKPIQSFVLFQIGCQLALLFSAIGPLRVVVRVAAFGASLFLLFFLRGRGQEHPATQPAIIALAIITLSIIHPTTNNFMSGLAQVALYFAILGPLFWVPRIDVDMDALRRIVMTIWLFQTLSAGVGVLQVLFPGYFQFNVSSIITGSNKAAIEGLYITTASGERVFRPMGLTDNPGGASMAGLYAVLFGAGFLFTSSKTWLKAMCVGSMIAGMMCLYLSQVRSVMVMTVISMLVFGLMIGRRLQMAKLTTLAIVLGIVLVGGLSWAILLGGEGVSNRLATLNSNRLDEVYYTNRGGFLKQTVEELLPLYPFGAGLGRWGMTNQYFGDNSNTERQSIYVEIQWTGWLLDGGLPLIFAYLSAILVAIHVAWKLAVSRSSGEKQDIWIWGALLLAYNVAAIAMTFNYALFIGQSGLEFWLINALFFAATRNKFPRLDSSIRVR